MDSAKLLQKNKEKKKKQTPNSFLWVANNIQSRTQSTLKIPKYWIKSYRNVYVNNTKTLE